MADPEPTDWNRIRKEPKLAVNLLIFISLTLFVAVVHWLQKSFVQYVAEIFLIPLLCFLIAWSERFFDICRTTIRFENLTVPLILKRNQEYMKHLNVNSHSHMCTNKDDQKRTSFSKLWPYDDLNVKKLSEYFVGYLDVDGVKELVTENGEFLIGVTGEKELQAKLWVMWNDVVKNVPIDEITEPADNETKIFCIKDNRKFPDIGSLITWYTSRNETLNVTEADGTKLQIQLAKTDEWHPDRTWYISSSMLTVVGMLSAHKSIFRGVMRINVQNTTVMIKCPREGTFETVTVHLLKESRLARHLNHPNVVRYYGVAVDSYRIMLTMDVGEIDMHKCLKQCDMPLLLKLKFAQDIALGMRHITSEKVLHNDLCLLNSVIFKDPKYGLVVKVVDFDLAINMEEDKEFTDLTVLPRVPAPYMSPEALSGLGSEKSAVWQFGLTLWELLTDGCVPYDNYLDESFINIVLDRGCTLPVANVPAEINELVNRCWEYKYFRRPSFDEICHQMSYLLGQMDNICARVEFESKYPVIIYAFNTSVKLLILAVRYTNYAINSNVSIESKLPDLATSLKMITNKTWLCFAGDNFSISCVVFNFDVIHFKIASTKILLISIN